MSARVLICGSRDFTDISMILAVVDALPLHAVVILGGAKGADDIAEKCAQSRGLRVLVFPANWQRDGKAAGPIRNQRMIDEGRPTEAHAFPLASSRGTWDMVRRCKTEGVPITVHGEVRPVRGEDGK